VHVTHVDLVFISKAECHLHVKHVNCTTFILTHVKMRVTHVSRMSRMSGLSLAMSYGTPRRERT
jgi:hypothetical protein